MVRTVCNQFALAVFLHSVLMESYAWSKIESTILEFSGDNPHREGTAAHSKFESVKMCGSVAEAKSKARRHRTWLNIIRRGS